MLNLKTWLLERQEGDDGTGHCDYDLVQCDFCGEWYQNEEE